MQEDKFDPKTGQTEFLSKEQRSFMSDSVQDPESPPKTKGFFEKMWGWFTLEHYKEYFDVTEEQVISRLTRALFPFSGKQLFENNKEDLYGPLWIFITLNICMAIFGYLAVYIDHTFDEVQYESIIEAHKIAKSYGFLLFYFVVIPAAIYFVLSFLASESPGYAKILAVYGYSFAIFIPTTFLFLIPSDIARWFFLIAAGLVSLWILFMELVLNGMEYLEQFQIYAIAGMQAFLHIVFICCMKYYFFV